jgi:hypothetical protein
MLNRAQELVFRLSFKGRKIATSSTLCFDFAVDQEPLKKELVTGGAAVFFVGHMRCLKVRAV